MVDLHVMRILFRTTFALWLLLMTVLVLTTSFKNLATQQGTLAVVSQSGMHYWLGKVSVGHRERDSVRAMRDLAGKRLWSPDGSRLTFTSYWSRHYGNEEIFVVSAQTGSAQNVSQHSGQDHSPVWSPDSTQLAFVSDRTGNRDIYVVASDGGNLRNVTNHPAADYAPLWSPDGRLLAFISDRDGNREIYVVDLALTRATNISRSSAQDLEFVWLTEPEEN